MWSSWWWWCYRNPCSWQNLNSPPTGTSTSPLQLVPNPSPIFSVQRAVNSIGMPSKNCHGKFGPSPPRVDTGATIWCKGHSWWNRLEGLRQYWQGVSPLQCNAMFANSKTRLSKWERANKIPCQSVLLLIYLPSVNSSPIWLLVQSTRPSWTVQIIVWSRF